MSKFTQAQKYGVDISWLDAKEALFGGPLEDEQIEQLLVDGGGPDEWMWSERYVHNTQDDTYITHIPAAKKPLVLPGDVHRAIISAYSNWGGSPSSVNRIATSFNLPREWVVQYLAAHGHTHDSPPFTREQLAGLSEEELTDIVLAKKRGSVALKYANKSWQQTKKDADKWRAFQRGMLDPFEGEQPKITVAKVARARRIGHECALFVGVSDTHVGERMDEFTTNNTVTTESVRAEVIHASHDLLDKVLKKHTPSVVFIPYGSDWVTVAGISSTTAKGTPQETDGSGPLVFRQQIEIKVELIENIRSRLPKDTAIKLVYMGGNHDGVSALALGMYLDAYYRNDNMVEVDYVPKVRKYTTYGSTLIATHHGHTHKPEKAVQLARIEAPREWGMAKERYVVSGHEHTFRMFDVGEATVIQLPSTAGSTRWATDHGHLGSRKALLGLVFDKDRGLEGVEFGLTD